jgi:hypothetical protein
MSNDMSRRRALLLSLGGALGLSLPTALIAEEAEAQATETPAAGTAPRHRNSRNGAVTGTWLWPNEVSRARLEFRPPSLPANFGTLRL